MAVLTTDEAYSLDRMNSHAFKYTLGTRLKAVEDGLAALDTPGEITGTLITGFVSGAGTVAASDTVLQAINKLDGNVAGTIIVANAALPSASFTAAAVTGKLITGYVSGAGIVAATDTILEAINKLNGNTLAITPSHRVMFAGEFTTEGGDAAEAITVAGALATDLVLVNVKTSGTGTRTVMAAAAATDAINVTMSGDPTTDHVLQYFVFRAI